MRIWRLIELETYDAFMNMAIDEAILRARTESLVVDTLRFYRWKRSAVSIGRFQNADIEVHLKNCAEQGVDVVRRITGGGTVYHDVEDEVTYSLVAARESLKAKGIDEVYSRVYSGITNGLRILGLTPDFNEGTVKACPNLTVNGRKVSGSAQCHRRGIVLQHGTILVGARLERMFSCLRVPWAESCMQVVNVAKSRITSLQDELHRKVAVYEVNKALIEGFQRSLSMKLVSGKLTAYEQELAEKLYSQKYSRNEWNLQGENQV